MCSTHKGATWRNFVTFFFRRGIDVDVGDDVRDEHDVCISVPGSLNLIFHVAQSYGSTCFLTTTKKFRRAKFRTSPYTRRFRSIVVWMAIWRSRRILNSFHIKANTHATKYIHSEQGLTALLTKSHKGHVLQFTRQQVVAQQWQHTVFCLSKATSNRQFGTQEGHQKASRRLTKMARVCRGFHLGESSAIICLIMSLHDAWIFLVSSCSLIIDFRCCTHVIA